MVYNVVAALLVWLQYIRQLCDTISVWCLLTARRKLLLPILSIPTRSEKIPECEARGSATSSPNPLSHTMGRHSSIVLDD